MVSAATLLLPNEEVKKKIKVEVNENVKTKDRDLAHIKEWLRKQPHLPDKWDDERLINFLRGSNFSLEKCKTKLDLYFTMRAACPEFFTNRDVTRPEIARSLSKIQGAPLPVLTPNGLRVNCFRVMDENLDSSFVSSLLKLSLMLGDVRLKEEAEGVAGDVYVMDVAPLSPAHLTLLSLTTIKKYLICVQDAYPVKLKEIHVVNSNPVIDVVFNMVKPLVKEKIRNRIFFHCSVDGLTKYIPKDILPEEFGGYGGSLQEMHNAWEEKLKTYTKWFKEQESIKAIETLRPGKPKNYDEILGTEGSFRTLSID
ncbi:alpha-tocopherol transfer protein-like [Aricia agestis]|uniref:alpha-tocopherol transfer protein-like n=1 Tax=Aricia agestis TaxID=91739 RepID=UPI001C208A45|nr:alpha-tocopherol transfer protein-like [Aricia agestis]XP_041971723.1 alpha-tocopherol transfer protein-like [Aricia agestis]